MTKRAIKQPADVPIDSMFLWFPSRKRSGHPRAGPGGRFVNPDRAREDPADVGDRYPCGGGYRILRRPYLLDEE